MHRIIISILLVFISLNANAQSLKKLQTRDTLFHTYKLDENQLEYIHRNKSFRDTAWMLTHPFNKTSNSIQSYGDTMPYGSYLEVSIVENVVSARLLQRFPFIIKIKKIDNDIVLFLKSVKSKDSMYAVISDATLRFDNLILAFDTSVGGYVLPYDSLKNSSPDRYLSIEYQNNNYIQTLNFTPEVIAKKQRKPKKPYEANAYGYCVVDKPIYRLGDSLRLKAYMLDNTSGEPIQKEATIEIKDLTQNKIVFTKNIENISPGAYVFDWIVADTLLQDRNYSANVYYKDKENRPVGITTSFRLESYILDKNVLTFAPSKSEYKAGEPIEFIATTQDANGFALNNIKLNYTVKISNVFGIERDTLTMSDSLKQNFRKVDTMLGYEKIHRFLIDYQSLPEASMTLNINGTITDAQFEKTPFSFNVNYFSKRDQTLFYQKQDSVILKYLVLGQDAKKKFTIQTYNQFNKKVDSLEVISPYQHKINPKITRVELLDSNKTVIASQNIFYNQLEILNAKGERNAKSIKLSFTYPFEDKVYYRVYKNDKIKTKGSGKNFFLEVNDTTLDQYSILMTHNANGNIEQNFYKMTFYTKDKEITLKTNLPERAFPGQTLPLEISATDWYGKPIENFNITSFAVNNQFKNRLSAPYIHVPSQYRLSVNTEHLPNLYPNLTLSSLNFEDRNFIKPAHIVAFDLYKNEFYQLLFPKNGMTIIKNPKQFPTPELTVMISYQGKLYAPKYFELDHKLQAIAHVSNPLQYSFAAKEGEHRLTIRAFNKSIYIPKIILTPYHKHYISIHLDSLTKNSFPKDIIVKDSLSFTTLNPAERKKIENSLVLFYNYSIDSVFRIINDDLTKIQFKRFDASFPKIRIDQDNLSVLGPLNFNEVIFESGRWNSKVESKLQTGRVISYFEYYHSNIKEKEIDKRSIIDINFNDQEIPYANIPYLLEPDTIIPQKPEPIPQIITQKPIEEPTYFEPNAYAYNQRRNLSAQNLKIHFFQKNKKKITACWVINKTEKDRSQYFNQIYDNFVFYTDNANLPIDIYLFTQDHELKIYRNVKLKPHTTLYIDATHLATDSIKEEDLALPIQIYNKLTEIPQLPFYYNPKEYKNLKLSQTNQLNEPGKAHFIGNINDENLSPIPNVYVILEKNGVFQYGAYTNQKGEFEFLHIPANTYDIKIFHQDYLMKYYYQVNIGGKFQQMTLFRLQDKENQRPDFEEISNDFRLSINRAKSSSSLMVNVFDRETRMILKNAMLNIQSGQINKTIPNPTDKAFNYNNEDNNLVLEIVCKGFKSKEFSISELEIENNLELDVFLSSTALAEPEIEEEYLSVDMIRSKLEDEIQSVHTGTICPDIYGKITDEAGNPLQGVRVSIQNNPYESQRASKKSNIKPYKYAISDRHGLYKIPCVEKADGQPIYVNLSASANGRETRNWEELEIEAYSDLAVNFSMKIARKKIQPVVLKSQKDKKSPLQDLSNEKRISKKEVYAPSEKKVSDLAGSFGGVIQEERMKVSEYAEGSSVALSSVSGGGLKTGKNSMGNSKMPSAPNQSKDQEGTEDGDGSEDADKKTNDPTKPKEKIDGMLDELINAGMGNQLRKNFSDVGYWARNLITDAQGKTYTQIKLPDNITQWRSFT
ncbi:MAG: hypothetical protein MUE53_09145, partial [Chitinophagales bacterium]|nr:hypothetical protein [Chitinophagales bacterium]